MIPSTAVAVGPNGLRLDLSSGSPVLSPLRSALLLHCDGWPEPAPHTPDCELDFGYADSAMFTHDGFMANDSSLRCY